MEIIADGMTNGKQHTPGPWSIYDWGAAGGFGLEIEAGSLTIAAAYFTGRDDASLANARLIAAAPDLLAACEAAAELIDLDVNEGADRRGVQVLLAAAMAKATGGAA